MLDYGYDTEFPDLAYPMRPLFTTSYTPKFIVTPSFDSWGMSQIPLFTLQANTTIDTTYLEKVIIQVNDPDDHETINAIAA